MAWCVSTDSTPTPGASLMDASCENSLGIGIAPGQGLYLGRESSRECCAHQFQAHASKHGKSKSQQYCPPQQVNDLRSQEAKVLMRDNRRTQIGERHGINEQQLLALGKQGNCKAEIEESCKNDVNGYGAPQPRAHVLELT